MVKPRQGSGARSIHRADDARAAEFFVDYVEEPTMVQRLMDGPEFSIDCLSDLDGRCLNAIPRTMIESRGGESIKGTVIADRELIELGRRVVEALGVRGPCTVQVFRDREIGLGITDVNTRFGGAFPAPMYAALPGPHLPRADRADGARRADRAARRRVPRRGHVHALLLAARARRAAAADRPGHRRAAGAAGAALTLAAGLAGPRPRRPAVVDELGDLGRQARRPDAQLDDRVRVDQAARWGARRRVVGVGERVHRVAGMADHERRRLERLADGASGAVRPNRIPWRTAPLGPGSWAIASSTSSTVNGTTWRGTHLAPRASALHHRLAEREREQQRGERGRAGGDRVVEHGHLDHHPAQPLGRDRGQLERDVRSERGAADDRLVELEVVEQRQRLPGELGDRVAPHLPGSVGGPVAEGVERDHAVAVRGEVGASGVCIFCDISSPGIRTVVRGPSPWIV